VTFDAQAHVVRLRAIASAISEAADALRRESAGSMPVAAPVRPTLDLADVSGFAGPDDEESTEPGASLPPLPIIRAGEAQVAMVAALDGLTTSFQHVEATAMAVARALDELHAKGNPS